MTQAKKTLMKVTRCDEHDHVVVEIDGEQVIQNDHGIDNVLRVAKYLKWKVVLETIDGDEFERRYA